MKYSQPSNLKSFYQSIKYDNLSLFIKQFDLLKPILIKQNIKNFLIYAFENSSEKIIKYLFQNEKHFCDNYILNTKYEKIGKEPLDFISLSVTSSHPDKTLYYLKKHISLEILKTIFENNEETITRLGLIKLGHNNWLNFYNLFSSQVNAVIKKDKYSDFAFIIATFNNKGHIPLIKYLNHSATNSVGMTPFIAACKFSNLEIIKEFLNYNNPNAEFINDYHCINLSVFNEDINVLKFFLNEMKTNNIERKAGIAPLYLSISDGMIDKSLFLVKETDEEVSEAILNLSSHLKTEHNKLLILELSKYLKDEHLIELSTNINMTTEFWVNAFSNLYLHEIQLLLSNSSFKKSFDILNKSPANSHYIFNASLIGRRDVNLKLDFLLEHLPIINSSNSDCFFNGAIVNNELYFKIKNQRMKPIKNFSLASSLMNLPINQIKNILEQTKISSHLDNYDYFVLYALGLQKKSLGFMRYIKNKKIQFPLITEQERNLSDFVQNILINLQENKQYSISSLKFKNKYIDIISTFEEPPRNFISKLACSLLDKDGTINDILAINNLFNNNKQYMSSFHNSIIAFLLQKENIDDELMKYYSKYSNQISKVCFAKLINLNIVENFGDKNLIRFLEIPFVDPSEDSVLSSLDWHTENEEVFYNIEIFENVKPNQLFNIFCSHQLKNIKSKRYDKKIIKHYNLRTWSMLLSIVDSSNPQASLFIDKLLKITDFSIDNYFYKNKNISLDNFKKISHHFNLTKDFWQSLFNYYKDDFSSLASCHIIYLNYITQKDNLHLHTQYINNSVSFLKKNNLLTQNSSIHLLCNLIASSSELDFERDINVSLFLSLSENLSKENYLKLLEHCLENSNYVYCHHIISKLQDSNIEIIEQINKTYNTFLLHDEQKILPLLSFLQKINFNNELILLNYNLFNQTMKAHRQLTNYNIILEHFSNFIQGLNEKQKQIIPLNMYDETINIFLSKEYQTINNHVNSFITPLNLKIMSSIIIENPSLITKIKEFDILNSDAYKLALKTPEGQQLVNLQREFELNNLLTPINKDKKIINKKIKI